MTVVPCINALWQACDTFNCIKWIFVEVIYELHISLIIILTYEGNSTHIKIHNIYIYTEGKVQFSPALLRLVFRMSNVCFIPYVVQLNLLT